MIDRDDGFRLLSGERERSSGTRERSANRDAELVDGLLQRKTQHRAEFQVEVPEYLPADQRTLLGGKKESALVQQHNNQIVAIHSAGVINDFGIRQGLRLEVVGVYEGARCLSAIVGVFHSLPAASLEATLVQEFVLDSAERTRQIITQASENYRRKAFG